MTFLRRMTLGLLGAATLLAATTAHARLCAPGMYCPRTMQTVRSFATHLGGCNAGGGCGTFHVTGTFTMTGTGEERNCMTTVGEPCGNIVGIMPNGDVDWSMNGSWSGPPY